MRMACEAVARAVPDRNGTLMHDGERLTAERLRFMIDVHLLRMGFQNPPSIVACGPQGADCHEHGHGDLRTGQPVIVDIFPRCMKTLYNGDCTRTVVNGEPHPEVRRMHAAVVEAKRAAIAKVRAGATGEDVHRETLRVIHAHGFPSGMPPADAPSPEEPPAPATPFDPVLLPASPDDAAPLPESAVGPLVEPRLSAVAVSFPRFGRFVSDTTVAQGLLRLLGSTSIEWRIADGQYSAKSDTYDDSGRVYVSLTSEGRIDPEFGVAPERYVEKRLNRAPLATNFQWSQGKVTFSNSSRELPLRPGVQDQLSFLAQLALIAQAFPERLRPASGLALEVAGTRDLRTYEFAVVGWERLSLPVGTVDTLKLERIVPGEGRDLRIELWLSPDHRWLPARTRTVLPNDQTVETVLREVKIGQ